MSEIIEEVRAFKAQRLEREAQARQLVALRLISGVDLQAALRASPDEAASIVKRLTRLVERERIKGLRRHWAYDLNRHIALKQALDQICRVHGCQAPSRLGSTKAPWKTRRRPKAPPK